MRFLPALFYSFIKCFRFFQIASYLILFYLLHFLWPEIHQTYHHIFHSILLPFLSSLSSVLLPLLFSLPKQLQYFLSADQSLADSLSA